MRKLLLGMLAVGLVVTLGTIVSIAKPYPAAKQIPKQKIYPKPPPVPNKLTDLQLLEIYSSRCSSCDKDLDKVDAVYMENVSVRVYNKPPQGKPGTGTNATIMLTYYDMAGKANSLRKTIFLKKWDDQDVTLITRPILFKKSRGLTAVILPSTPRVGDPNQTNNKMTIKNCMVKGPE